MNWLELDKDLKTQTAARSFKDRETVLRTWGTGDSPQRIYLLWGPWEPRIRLLEVDGSSWTAWNVRDRGKIEDFIESLELNGSLEHLPLLMDPCDEVSGTWLPLED